MKYKIENNIITAYYHEGKDSEDNDIYTYMALPYLSENSIKDLYIISRHMVNRKLLEGEVPTDLKTFKPNPVATKIKVGSFFQLQAEIYDQYGAKLNVTPDWSIEGEGARIVDGAIVEDEVTEKKTYKIICRLGELEESQTRLLLPPGDAPQIPGTPVYDEEALNELKRENERLKQENTEIKSDIANITEAINKIIGADEGVAE